MATIAEIAARAGLSASTVSLVLRKKPPYSEEAARKVAEAAKALNHKTDTPTVTARDVAAYAGVSVATVSNVINGYPVSAEYRAMVNEAIQALGYEPPVRKEVRQKKQNKIIIVDDFSNKNMTSGILSTLEQSPYEPLLFCRDMCTADDLTALLESREAQGVIFCNCSEKAMVPEISLRFPAIQCGFYSDEAGGNIVAPDYEWCAYEMTRQLLQTGKQHIALIAYGSTSNTYTTLCTEGYSRALRESGLEPRSEWILGSGSVFDGSFGTLPEIYYEEQSRILSTLMGAPGQTPNGFVFLNSYFALIYQHILQARGYQIPQQLTLGCLSSTMRCACDPPFAVIGQPCLDVGVEAVRQLIARIENPNLAPRRILFRPEKTRGDLLTGRGTDTTV